MPDNFETRVARSGMSVTEIQKFVGDFTDALVRLALKRVREVDIEVEQFGCGFDGITGSLDWKDAGLLATAGIEVSWISGIQAPHRTFMHPNFVTNVSMWDFVTDYVKISMVSDKASRVLFPNLVKSRRPKGVSNHDLLIEAKMLNRYLHIVREAGLTGDRIISYRGDLRVHGQGQNDSGRIGAVGATVAILDALHEIRSGAVVSTYGTIPSRAYSAPADIVRQMTTPGYSVPKALLLTSQRAIVFSADPDVAIISRIGGGRPYASAQEASEEWARLKKRTAWERIAVIHQAALGEVKTALDPSNVHERLALGSRENRAEAHAIRFLLMAILTPDIVDSERVGRRAMFSKDAQRFQEVFNLYFLWGYDSSREAHAEHWNDFKRVLKTWTGL